MLVAVVGNRRGWKPQDVYHVLYEEINLEEDTLISGGAAGVDAYVVWWAQLAGVPITIRFPSPRLPSPQRYHIRNQAIVDAADRLIAFNHPPGKRSGTLSTINRARKKGIPILPPRRDRSPCQNRNQK